MSTITILVRFASSTTLTLVFLAWPKTMASIDSHHCRSVLYCWKSMYIKIIINERYLLLKKIILKWLKIDFFFQTKTSRVIFCYLLTFRVATHRFCIHPIITIHKIKDDSREKCSFVQLLSSSNRKYF